MNFTRSGIFFCILLVLTGLPLFAQEQHLYTISGTLRAGDTGEPLIGATALVVELNQGATTNETGFYSLSLPEGTHNIQFSYLGFKTVTNQVTITHDLQLDVKLSTAETELKEVVIEAGSLSEKLRNVQMSVDKLTSKEAKLLPALFGEVDLIKTLQLKPGVQAGGEGSSGLYVRGGGPDQNLFLLDNATVYNATHLFGFFSIFNPDAIESVELYKGGFPAQYGGRLSSVVDIRLREGNKNNFSTSGGLGLIASRLTVEGPIQRGKSSFLISGRRTYFDVFTRQYNRLNKDKKDFDPIPDYYFYDLNGRCDFVIGPNDKLSMSAYYGNDVFGFQNNGLRFDFTWGNRVGVLRWNHRFGGKLFSNLTISASRYQYTIKNSIDTRSFNLASSINDLNGKIDFDYLLNSEHALKFGISAINHQFGVGRLQAGSSDAGTIFSSDINYTGSEYGAYVSDDYAFNSRLAVNYGVRLSAFTNTPTTFWGLEPRVSARYALTESVSIKGSYTRMMQYVHLVTNSGASLPTDVWYPSNATVKPQRSNQAALGISKLFNGKFLLTNEVYYKWMLNQIDFRDGAQLYVNPNLDQEFIFGKGQSYGNEIYLEKKTGKTTGWLGYTLSWTNRTFPDINNGKTFPTRYDRRHDLTFVLMHQLNKRINVSATWVYGSGNAYSVPYGKIVIQDVPYSRPMFAPLYSPERNNYRMVPYHRLDLGLVYDLQTKHGQSDLTFSIYNVYNRRNPYFIFIDSIRNGDGTKTLGFRAKQVSLFPIILSVTYNFKF